jgi:hypothetical protein
VVWCGVVWCGVVWCGVVWCGVVWCGVTSAAALCLYASACFAGAASLQSKHRRSIQHACNSATYTGNHSNLFHVYSITWLMKSIIEVDPVRPMAMTNTHLGCGSQPVLLGRLGSSCCMRDLLPAAWPPLDAAAASKITRRSSSRPPTKLRMLMPAMPCKPLRWRADSSMLVFCRAIDVCTNRELRANRGTGAVRLTALRPRLKHKQSALPHTLSELRPLPCVTCFHLCGGALSYWRCCHAITACMAACWCLELKWTRHTSAGVMVGQLLRPQLLLLLLLAAAATAAAAGGHARVDPAAAAPIMVAGSDGTPPAAVDTVAKRRVHDAGSVGAEGADA